MEPPAQAEDQPAGDRQLPGSQFRHEAPRQDHHDRERSEAGGEDRLRHRIAESMRQDTEPFLGYETGDDFVDLATQFFLLGFQGRQLGLVGRSFDLRGNFLPFRPRSFQG